MGIDGDRDRPSGAPWDNPADEPLETEQLALAGEERLPWLESSDDDDGDDAGSATGRLIVFAIFGLALLMALIGAIWWVTHSGPDDAVLADGSTIEAPKTPYKEAPRDPGGKTFDGTGDSSYSVSEGKSRPAQLGDQPMAAPLAPPPPQAVVPSGKPTLAGAVPAAKVGGSSVQVGAFSSQAVAEAAWAKLVGQANGALSGVSHRVIEGNADIGKVYRLQAVAGDATGAAALCAKLKAAGIACQVK